MIHKTARDVQEGTNEKKINKKKVYKINRNIKRRHETRSQTSKEEENRQENHE